MIRHHRRDRLPLAANLPGLGADLYLRPRIVLFRKRHNGGRCGMAQSRWGLSTVAGKSRFCLDTGFFREIETRFRGCWEALPSSPRPISSPHEAGHHIQTPARHPAGDETTATGGRQARRPPSPCGEGGIAGRCYRALGQMRGEEARVSSRRRYRWRVENRVGDRGDDTLPAAGDRGVVPDSFTTRRG